MTLYKRGKTWHTDFSVNGERFRQSVETTDWREAHAKEKELIKAPSDGKLHSAHRLWPKADPERPMGVGGWRSAWRSLRNRAGFE